VKLMKNMQKLLPKLDSILKIIKLSFSKTLKKKMAEKRALLGMTLQEMEQTVTSLGMPRFTAKQLAQWVYQKNADSIEAMTNLSQKNRALLSEQCVIGKMPHTERLESVDGTVKYLFPTAGGESVEAVFIPEADRGTLCVSSQVGCRMGCRFCMTGRQGFQGNCSATDILNQIYALPEWERLTNIVFMGQGEPMDNLDAVLRACDVLTAPWGFAWSPKRITVSSVGVRRHLQRFLDESQCHVAISLHSPLHEQRQRLMPAEKAMPIAETVALLKQSDFTHQRRCSFEYICFGGMNDSPVYAREIVRLLEGLECRVNLIRFHEIPGVDLPSSDERRMEALRDYLTQHGITTTIRASRGQDILAACGMLSTAKQNQEHRNHGTPE